MILHYLSDGSIVIAISYEKELFYVPLVFILKVSVNFSVCIMLLVMHL